MNKKLIVDVLNVVSEMNAMYSLCIHIPQTTRTLIPVNRFPLSTDLRQLVTKAITL